MKNRKYLQIKIPASWYNEIKHKYCASDFATPEDFILEIIRTLLNMADQESSLTENEERLIEERLKSLGYL